MKRLLTPLLLSLILIFSGVLLSAQKTYKLKFSKVFKSVPYINEPPEDFEVVAFPADNDILAAWKKIVSVARTPNNKEILDKILIKSANISNIFSYKQQTNDIEENLIFYDKLFFNQFEGIKGIDVSYLMLFSLAHELGHFINGDVNNGVQSVQSELNADEFACSVLCTLQLASEDRINNVLLALTGATDGIKNYPRKGDRIKRISRFFNNGKCLSIKKMDYEDFSTTRNPWNFWVGQNEDYYAKINTVAKTYELSLNEKPSWNWTWIPFSPDMDALFNDNNGAQISFDFVSNSTLTTELFGFMSEPECVSNSCLGGSHYDLWFTKSKQSENRYILSARFFFNDNCSCRPQNEINKINNSISTGAVSNIRIVKYEKKYTIYCDDQVLISFNINSSIVNKLIYGLGTHYISNFRAQVL